MATLVVLLPTLRWLALLALRAVESLAVAQLRKLPRNFRTSGNDTDHLVSEIA